MRATLIVVAVLIAAFFVAHFRVATAETCTDSCAAKYAACTKHCKDTNCYTKCLNERESCLGSCK